MKIRAVVAFAVIIAVAGPCLRAEQAPKPAAEPAVKAAAAEPNTDEVVARVNGKEIKRKELDAAVTALRAQMARRGRAVPPAELPGFERDVLEEIIGRELILQEGSKTPPADLEQKVQTQLDTLKAQLGGEEELARTLQETGVTRQEYEKRVHDNIVIQETMRRIVDARLQIGDEQVREFYEQNPGHFRQPEMVRASHILVRVPPNAEQQVKADKRSQIEAARALIRGGESFAEVAKKVSEDPGSAANGGDLGFFPRGAMVPEFETAAFTLKTNELSEVITTQFGYHVLIVTDRKPAQQVAFEEVKDDIKNFLRSRKGSEIARNHVAELRQSANIEVLLAQPSPPPAPVVETPPVQSPQP